MTDMSVPAAPASRHTGPEARLRLEKRYASERRFERYGMAALSFAIAALFLLLWTILSNGATAFFQTHIRLEVHFDPATIDPDGKRDPAAFRQANWAAVARAALQEKFPEVRGRLPLRQLDALLSDGAQIELLRMVSADPGLLGQRREVWLLTSSDVDMIQKGHSARDVPEASRRVNDAQLSWLDRLAAEGRLEKRFNTRFFTAADSRQPELVGVWGGVVGSFLTLGMTLLLAFPMGVAAAIYLEEYAPKNRFTDLIEVNINNLAAVPSIVYGLLGLAVFLQFFGMPRSAPIVGGVVLALMSLPIIIIASRAALRSVPPSIREAALGIGASKMQAIFHHILPLAMPGIMTGTIIALAHALGETAPLLMIGMVAFVVDIPAGPLSPSTVLPVQIFMWADNPERGFVEKTSAAIMTLLVFLLLMNAAAIWLRKKFERRW
ncbi:MAG: phosphate ABC transporter permease PstA [Rhodospirillales bacterium]|nr:phosphate ABC transporter permease PstA [Rhodospirillales bacterium]